ncbi:glycerol-3-phosphate 1-O-acyltransferase PlsY [Anaerovorax odorimutans]|uniref:glycerol-3-phosphate 1-O-acyltransferase PlsY n=1 Tax=Anaerovorax odorimutans TaxID=109327 RepID=UPI0003FA81FF|nr:glycerol-3-phosphate 1-O-acyltransferase PlsY [Anaerovorax odorimutans]
MSNVIIPIISVIVSYFLGNISPAILIGKLYGIDIRKQGSGNAGTTNVLRTLGKKAAAATLFIDIFKGVLAVIIGRLLGGEQLAVICGLAAFIGHIWPMAFSFRGGKGVATGIGIILTVNYILGIIVAIIALAVMAITKRVSAGSVIGAVSLPIVSYFICPQYLLWLCIMAVIVIIKHRENIKRLLKGEEPKFSFKK